MTFELKLPNGDTHTLTAATDGETVVKVIAIVKQSVSVQQLGKDDQQRDTYACVAASGTIGILTRTA